MKQFTTNSDQKALPSNKVRPVLHMLIAALVLLNFTTIGCSKYKDGPIISLRSKTERVANNWKVGEAFDNGRDVTSDFSRYNLNLTKGGRATLTAKYKFNGGDLDYNTSGTWKFVSDQQKISLDVGNNDAKGLYEILRLKMDDMWLKKDGGTLELHLVPM